MSNKIFWCHPQLRDYRKPLFEMIDSGYKVTFFFIMDNKKIKNEFKIVSKANNKFGNFIILYKNICESDIFISSFLSSIYSISGLFISKVLRKKVIIWEEKWDWNTKTFKKRRKKFFAKISCKFVDSFYVMGEPQKIGLIQLGVKKENIFVANEYTPVNYCKHSIKIVNDLSYLEKKFVVLYFGRFLEVKGIKYLIEAYHQFDDNSDMHLLIVGYGDLEKELKKYSQDLGISNVTFHAPIFEESEKTYLFKKIGNVAVIPSIITHKGQQEGGPITILEYLSSGLPVIISDAMGNGIQHINKNNGYITEWGDSNSISEAINKVYVNYKKFSRKKIINEFKQIKGYENQYNILRKAIESAKKK